MSDYILTPDEIIQLAREYENVRRWEGVREFVYTLFGPQAVQATITIISEYNDFRNDDEVGITVLDKDGHILDYDWNLPWWHQFPLKYEDFVKIVSTEERVGLWVPDEWSPSLEFHEEVANALRTFFTQTIGVELIQNGNDHDAITLAFQLDTPPAVRFPVVYAVLS